MHVVGSPLDEISVDVFGIYTQNVRPSQHHVIEVSKTEGIADMLAKPPCPGSPSH